MDDPRNIHAAKSPLQKRTYIEGLKTPMPANPTYKKHVEKTTDAVQEAEIISEGLNTVPLRPYTRERRIGLREGVVAIIATVIGGALLYFIIDVSGKVAALQERTESQKQRIESVEKDLKDQNKLIDNLNIEIEVLKRSERK